MASCWPLAPAFLEWCWRAREAGLFVRVFQPITIMSALPLSLGGAVLALLLTGIPFSLPVMIGVLMLMGIVAKNSILLVDFAIEEMRAGKPRLEAILQAGHYNGPASSS